MNSIGLVILLALIGAIIGNPKVYEEMSPVALPFIAGTIILILILIVIDKIWQKLRRPR